jgi:Phasin protein
VAADRSQKTSPFDPQALIDAQKRSFDAFTNAGQIVADGMRTYAERQIAMVQEAMTSLMGEVQANVHKPQPAAAAPTEQLDRMRVAFEKVMAQVQELGNLLLKVQTEAIAVLNDCATKNFETLGAATPEFAQLQQKAQDAFEAATRQITAVVDEMRKRMAAFDVETKPTAAASAPAAAPAPARPAAPPAPAPARTAATPAPAEARPAAASTPARAAPAPPPKAAAKPAAPRTKRATTKNNPKA